MEVKLSSVSLEKLFGGDSAAFQSTESIATFETMFKDAQWFVDLVYLIKDLKFTQQLNITDILVKSYTPVQLGMFKTFYHIDFFLSNPHSKFHKFHPTTRDLEMLKQIFKENGYISEEQNKRTSIDFSIAIYGFGILRMNYSRTENDIVLNMRYLDFMIPDFDNVGYPNSYIDFLTSLVDVKEVVINGHRLAHRIINTGGLIIHNGPTGSGKSTAIASEIAYFGQKTTGLIVTYEEPLEYRFITEPRILQFEVDRDIAKHEIKRHALRNNPNIIVWGEIRTKDELSDVIDLTTRGHLVITTLHAENVFEVLKLMANLLSEAEISAFASSVKAIVSHKLVLNSKGEPVTLFEIFRNSNIISKQLTDIKNSQVLKGLFNSLYNEQTTEYRKNVMTFKECVDLRVNQGKISGQERAYLFNNIFNYQRV